MAFLSLNGFALPVADATARRRVVKTGRRERAFRRPLRDMSRGARRTWDVDLVVLDPDAADAVIAAIQGRGHFFDMADGLQASTSLMPLAGVHSSVRMLPQTWGAHGRGAAWFGSASQPSAVRWDAQLPDAWTVLWREYGADHIWHTYAKRIDGAGFVDGARLDTIGETTGTHMSVVVVDGVVNFGPATVAPLMVDDVVVLPYRAPDAMLASWTVQAAPKFGPCPLVHLQGDAINGDVWAVGEVTDVRFVQKPNLLAGYGWLSNAKVISATFTEVEEAFALGPLAAAYSTPVPPGAPAWWFDGQDVDGQGNATLVDGVQVQTWVDKGSRAQNATQATLANRPAFRRIGELGLLASSSGVFFDGASRYMQTSVGAVVGAPVTVAIVFRHEATGVYRAVMDGVTAGGRLALDQFNIGSVHELFQGSFQQHPTVTVSAGMWNLSVARYQGAGTPWRLNGVNATVNPGASNAVAGITLGAFYNASNPFNGYIAEVVAWTDTSYGTFDAVVDYFTRKYGALPQT